MNLTQELLALLQQGQSTDGAYLPGAAVDPTNGQPIKQKSLNGAYFDQATNRFYQPYYSTSGGYDGEAQQETLAGYKGFDNAPDAAGKTNYDYDLNGNLRGTFGTNDFYARDNGEILAKTMIALMAGGAGAEALGGLGGAAGASGAPSFGYELGGGLGNSAAGMGGSSAAGGGGGLLSGIGDTISGGMKSIGNGISGMFGGGAAGGAGGATSFGVLGDPATATAMKNYGAAGLAKYALPALGAILGSQGQKTSQTTSRQTDPRLDPYYFDEGGLLPTARGLLQQQFSPQGMQAINNIGQAGQGLLQRPISTGKLIGRF